MKQNLILSLVLCAMLAGCKTEPSNSTTNNASRSNVAPSGQNTSTASAPTTSAQTTVSAADLFNAYKTNASAADAKYKGKTITVSGTVETNGVDPFGKVFVLFNVGDKLNAVRCSFPESAKSTVTTLKAGQPFTASGQVDGATAGDVMLSNCSIVK